MKEYKCHAKRGEDGSLSCPCATSIDEPIEVQCIASYLNEGLIPGVVERQNSEKEYRQLFGEEGTP